VTYLAAARLVVIVPAERSSRGTEGVRSTVDLGPRRAREPR
jgi:hypothetical protein